MDSLKGIKVALPVSYARLDETLRSLKDSDLELTGKHVRYGEKTLDWFLENVVTNHLSGHVEQIKWCLEAIR